MYKCHWQQPVWPVDTTFSPTNNRKYIYIIIFSDIIRMILTPKIIHESKEKKNARRLAHTSPLCAIRNNECINLDDDGVDNGPWLARCKRYYTFAKSQYAEQKRTPAMRLHIFQNGAQLRFTRKPFEKIRCWPNICVYIFLWQPLI